MSIHTATLRWSQDEEDHFSLGRYTRVHEIAFDGGTTIQATAAPGNVPAQFSSESAVDPEEMFVASIASCHMLWFLDFARRAKVEILSYQDNAEGLLEKGADGRTSITRVTLRPKIEATGEAIDMDALHHKAHEACFIANSVKTEIVIEPAG